jgi:hypothetical protein
LTVSRESPDRGLPENAAFGSIPIVIKFFLVAVLVPYTFVAVRETVYVQRLR